MGKYGNDFKAVSNPTAVNVTAPGDKPGLENVLTGSHVQCQLCGNVVVPAQSAGVKHCPACGKVLDSTIRLNTKGTLT